MTEILSPVEAIDVLNQLHSLPSRSRFGWELRAHGLADGLRYEVAVSMPRRRQDGTFGHRRSHFYTHRMRTPDEAIITAAMILVDLLGAPWEQIRTEIAR